MDFGYTPENEALRGEVRQFIAEHVTPALREELERWREQGPGPLTRDYAKWRVAFGQPIGAFQAIQHMCADMVIWVDGAQLLTCEALWKLGQGLPASTEVATAKAFCNERCQAALRHANQIHAGIAQIKEFDLNLWYRRAAAWTMKLGTAFDHRKRIAQALELT